jgi:hypothetical protein
MKIAMPLISIAGGPNVGFGNEVEIDERKVLRNTLSVLSHKPFTRPKPTIIHYGTLLGGLLGSST